MTKPKICVFAGATMPTDPAIVDAARQLGALIGQGGYDLMYGGGMTGVMGAVSQAAQQAGAGIVAITLRQYAHKPQLPGAQVTVVETELERYHLFRREEPCAKFVLPGGPGSLREALQGLETAVYEDGPPVILVQVGGYLDGIKLYYERALTAGLIATPRKDCLRVWMPGDALGTVLAV